MGESEAQEHDGAWATAWIREQRERLQQDPGSSGDSEAARVIGARWQALGAAWLEGLEQLAQQTAAPNGEHSLPPLRLGEELLNVWHSAWTLAGANQQGASAALADLVSRIPPLGPARECVNAWRELGAAQAESQSLEQELRSVLLSVQREALDLLDQRVRERGIGQLPVSSYRDLYALWVECAEEVYARVARSDMYGRLQAQLGNASIRLRSKQQKLIEYALRQLDLPTRAEINSVHLQLRQLKQRLATLESTSASGASPRPKARPRAKKKVTRGRKR